MRQLLTILLCYVVFGSSAQNPAVTCLSKTELAALVSNPELYRSKENSLNNAWSNAQNTNDVKRTPNKIKYVLPVVFHVVHENGTENLSDIRIQLGLDYLNQAFANIGYYDQQTGDNTQIQFCMAQRDPSNNPTLGINRIQSPLTTMAIQTNDIDLKNLSRWDPEQYINIWIVKEIISLSSGPGVAGYAFFPSAHGEDYDGIVIEAQHTGIDESLGTILVHEMGHYLGLYHTFEGGCKNNDCLLDGDLICDTPPDQSTAYAPCQTGMNTCNTDTDSGFQNDVNDNIENYMDYSDLNCYNQFTRLQKERMHFSIEHARASLLDSRSCAQPCPLSVTSSFTFPPLVPICDSSQIINNSLNADLYYWYLDGAYFSDAFQPQVWVSTRGQHELKLKAYSRDSSCLEITTFNFKANCPVNSDIVTQLPHCIRSIDSLITLVPYDEPGYTFEWYVNDTLQSTSQQFAFSYPAGVSKIKLISFSGKCIDSTEFNLLIGCEEICGNEIDDDGDGLVDCFDDDCCLECDDFYYDPCAPQVCPTITPAINIKEKWNLLQNDNYERFNFTSGDIDGDGEIELICRDGSIGEGFIIVSSDGTIENQLDWRATSDIISRYMHAIADVDRDETGEIFFMSSRDELVRMEHDGAITFVSLPLSLYHRNLFSYGSISIADLNFDQKPEIINEFNIVDAETGIILYAPDSVYERNFGRGRYILADLLPDNACQHCQGLEIVSGTRIFAPSFDNKSMDLAIEIPDYSPYATAVADWDLDGDEDVITSGKKNGVQKLTVWDGQTKLILHEITTDPSTSAITVGNFDQDPELELVYVESIQEYGIDCKVVLRDNDLSLVWEQVEFNMSFNSVGGFDFNADNILEVFYRARDYLTIINSVDGQIISLMPCYSFTGDERVLLADFDNDGHAEMATTCGDAIVAYEGIDEWPNTRPVHNQYAFYNTHINDDLTVPAYYQKRILQDPSGIYNSSLCHYRIPEYVKNEFSVENASVVCEDGQTKLIIDFCQYQNLQQDSISVSIYQNHPSSQQANHLLTYKIFISANDHGCFTDTILLDPNGFSGDSICVIINDDGSTNLPFDPLASFPITPLLECDYTDNVFCLPAQFGDTLTNVIDDFIMCINDTVALSIHGTWIDYLWRNGDESDSTTITTLGWHWIEVTNACGVKSRDSFFVEGLVTPTLNIPDSIINCEFSVYVLNAGPGFEIYRWSDGSQQSTTTVHSPGNYWVEVTDACDNVQRDTTVVIFTPLANLQLSDSVDLCIGDSIQLTVPAFNQIIWLPGIDASCTDCPSPFLYPDSPKYYYVFVYDDNGCSTNDSIFINIVDEISITDTINACGDSIFYRNSWYSEGNYLIQMYDSINCDTLLQLTVNLNDHIRLDTVVTICKNDSIYLFNRYFYHGIDSIMLSGTNTECDTIVIVSAQPIPIFKFMIDFIADSCTNNGLYTIKINSQSIRSATLFYDNVSPQGLIFMDLPPNEYTISILDSNNCQFDTTFILDSIAPRTFALPDSVSVRQGETIHVPLLGDTSFLESSIWDFDPSINCQLCPDLLATANASQYYFTTLVDNNGCLYRLKTFVHVNNVNRIFTPNVFSPNDDGINDIFSLYGNEINKIIVFNIFDRWGTRVFSRNNLVFSSSFGWDGTFKDRFANEGVYAYYFEVEMKNGDILKEKGDLTLIR